MKQKYLKKFFSCLLSCAMVLTVFSYTGNTVYAQENNAGSFNVTGGTDGTDWTYDSSGNTLTFNTNGTYTVTGDGQETQEKIVVADNFNGTITIENINIKAEYGECAFEVKNTAQLILNLKGENILKSSAQRAGLEFSNATGSLTITSDSNGSLTAAGGYDGAGIGGGKSSGNNITINGGTITATGGTDGAGIGGGDSSGSDITINGGIVTATGGMFGAGIGGGYNSSGSDITINGGTVTATGSYNGAGIGGGYNSSGSDITISNGSIKASSISTTPTDGNGKEVYLAKIDNMSGMNSITVDTDTYTRDGNHPDNDGIFYLYLTKENHQITANGNSASIEWDNDNNKFLTYDSEFIGLKLKISSTDLDSKWFYDLNANTFHINKGDFTIVGDGTETNKRISVADNFTGTITLENVNINGTDEIISLGENTHLTLKFNGENNLCTTTAKKATISTTYESSSLTFDSDINGILNVTSSSNGVAIGSMTNTYNIKFNGGTINAKGSSYQKSDIGVALYGNGDAKNIVVNGGTINCLTSALGSSYTGNGTYSIECEITINGGTVTAPCIGGSIDERLGQPNTKVVINGGSVKGKIQTYGFLTNSDNNPVYLAKLERLSGIDSVTVDSSSIYKRAGNHPDKDGTFYLYLTGQDHTLTVNGQTFTAHWYDDTKTFKYDNITPTVTIEKKTATSITVKPLDNAEIYGDAEYSINGTDWQGSNQFTDLTANTEYTVYARYKENDTYIQSENGSIKVTTKKDGNEVIKEPSDLKTVYEKKLSDVTLSKDWTWVNADTKVSVGEQKYSAHFDTKNYEDEYDFSNVQGYNAEGHYVERNLTVKVEKADSTLSITTQNMDKAYDRNSVSNPDVEKTGSTKEVVFTWYQEKSQGNWEKLDTAPTDAGQYKVVASVEADGNYKEASDEKEFVISQVTNTWGEALAIEGWTYGQSAKTPIATTTFGKVEFTYSDQENGMYTDDVPTDAGIWYVKATVVGNENYTGLEATQKFTISKAESSIAFKEDLKLDKTYDTEKVSIKDEDIVSTGSQGTIQLSYEEWNGTYWQTLTEAPINAGKYRVIATLKEDSNYLSATSKSLEFDISKADSTITIETDIMDKVYDENETDEPSVKKTGSTNNVVFNWYQKQSNDSWKQINKSPTNVGIYKVVVNVEADENYHGTSAEKEFEITKATTKYDIPVDLSMKQGDKLSSITLPNGFAWKDETQTVDTYGKQVFTAIFTPEDINNYQIIEVDITVDVLPLAITLNHIPMINAEDKTLKIGDTFDPMQDVKATDKEDGYLTDKIEVIKNTVDTTKAGTYSVTYKVTDSQGASSTKTITVTVKEKEDTNNPNSTDKTDSPKTGDSSNIGLYTSLLAMSGLLIILAVLKKKKTFEHR